MKEVAVNINQPAPDPNQWCRRFFPPARADRARPPAGPRRMRSRCRPGRLRSSGVAMYRAAPLDTIGHGARLLVGCRRAAEANRRPGTPPPNPSTRPTAATGRVRLATVGMVPAEN